MKLSNQHFWEWFSRNHQHILGLMEKPKKEMTYWTLELNSHLLAYSKLLGYELKWLRPDHLLFTITANGKSNLFKKIDSIVAKAPQIQGFTIEALDRPQPIDYFLDKEIEKTGADPCELKFSFDSPCKGKESLVIYHPMCTIDNYDDFNLLARGAVYNLLGERQFGMEIGQVAMNELILEPDLHYKDIIKEEVVYDLECLPEILGTRQSVIRVDKEGNLLM